MFTRLIKVGNDLVEQPETLDAHVVPVQLDVEVVEVGDGGEQHSDLSIGLVVQVLQGRKGKTGLIKRHLGFTNLWEQYNPF